MTLFDDKERWLRRPENPRPLSDRDWNEQRKLLHDLGNQITRYIALVQSEDIRMKNSVARADPIQIDEAENNRSQKNNNSKNVSQNK